MKEDESRIFGETKHEIYPEKSMKEFIKIIKKYEAADIEKGRDAINAKKLAALADESHELFRKRLNGNKPIPKRDYIILIGILLRMDSNVINNLLCRYGMRAFNPKNDLRDSELMAIADEAEAVKNPNLRLTRKQIDDKLVSAGFEKLDLKTREGKNTRNLKKNEKNTCSAKYEIVDYITYTSGDCKFADQYDSLSTRYGFHRYNFCSKMRLKEKDSGKEYILSASDRGSFISEEYPWPKEYEKFPWTSYQSLSDTGEFMEYFREMQTGIDGEKKRIGEIVNDTRNYRERVGAGIQNRKFHVFSESYNYGIPERNEYYFMEFIDGTYKLSVSNESMFMNMYLSKDEFKEHYGEKKIKPFVIYKSEEEIREKISKKGLSHFDKDLLRSRLYYYKKMKESVKECFDKILDRKEFVRNLNYVFDNPHDVCWFFKVEEEYDCHRDEMDMLTAGCTEHEFTFDFGTVVLSIEDLCRAFELGYETIDDICRVKYDTGAVDSILNIGTI